MKDPKDLEFYIGTKEIAKYLDCNLHTVRAWLRAGRIPAKKDTMGRWVLTNWDFLRYGIKPAKRKKRKKRKNLLTL